ncbi:FG-GAP-like repeat-containing protein [Amycolatopsis solani]|uniref:FG-GAP-like repeat-containing protein n=1 Tax=Amycolatopsis solani TaxID=3028615 RepID=UPI0025B244E0|nr:FG-GAP-like repeat-containing protein [Amycolatopsis sp. MEP2-6]
MPHRTRLASALVVALLAGGSLAVVPADAVSGGTTGTHGFAAKLTADGRACSGALVEPALVLTSARCFPENPQGGTPAKATTVTIGGHTAKVTALVTRSDRDVALARLDTTVTDVTPLPLGTAAGAPGASESLSLAGWGRTADEWVPDQVHVASFTTSSSTSTTLSLTGTDGADACKGDAGAPVFRPGGTVAGVVSSSWQHGCLAETETRQGTTAARVDDLGGWIRGQAIVGTAKAVGHGVTLSWTPLAASDDATYSIYANSAGPATTSATQLIGTTKAATFLHSATSRKTWSYLVVASNGAASPQFTATTGARSLTDFTGDGKADVATFIRGTAGDVYVANSEGTKFNGTSKLWQDYFGTGAEIPLSGDFNGDGRADAIVFKRGTGGDVLVALSDGTKFGTGVLWHDYFDINDEIPAVGDFNGDGKDDIALFKRGTSGDVLVALSDGTKFGTGTLWHDYFGIANELPYIGDFNGDGKDDIAVSIRGGAGDVYVALSDGTKFGASALWQDYFGINDELPAVGDFNGDGKDDIGLFKLGTTADVLVALSAGTKFGTGTLWHDYFGIASEVPLPRVITVM